MSKPSRFSENISHIEMDLFIDPNNSAINSNTMTMDKNPGFNLRFYPSMVPRSMAQSHEGCQPVCTPLPSGGKIWPTF